MSLIFSTDKPSTSIVSSIDVSTEINVSFPIQPNLTILLKATFAAPVLYGGSKKKSNQSIDQLDQETKLIHVVL